MSFAFIPRAVKKKDRSPVLVSSHASSASLSIGAQATSESHGVDSSRETKVLDQASESESVQKKIKIGKAYDQHTLRFVAGTETKPTIATSIAVQKDIFDLEDLAQLVCLALSDYAVWADVDLRRKIDWGHNQDLHNDNTGFIHDVSIDDNSGYIPLAYILRHSHVFRLASSSSSSIVDQPQTTFVKAIRTHTSHLIDVRLIIPSSSSSTFPANHSAQWHLPHIQTGYELRRKETSSALSKHGKKEWDALTIYVENIPNEYRTISGIARFLLGLLPPSPSSSFFNPSVPSVPRIQNISLLAHHRDQPNSIPTCKGFAVVTLSHDGDLKALLEAWPWDYPADVLNSDQSMQTDVKSAVINTKGKGKHKNLSAKEISPLHAEATKFGLRILTKARWEELRAEYLLYRQESIDEINNFQDEDEIGAYGGSGGGKRRRVDEMYDEEEQSTEEGPRRSIYNQSRPTKNTTIPADDSVSAAGIHPNSTYPPGCLVFVRNVHPQTNKTSLRNLFLHAREADGNEGGKKDDNGIAYLDYTKGLDCCYVRLRTPLHAQQLVDFLSFTPIIQTSGLDASGTSLAHLSSLEKDNSPSNPIIAEQVLGKREEFYWQKVPEKIRRQAVDKALTLHT